MKIKITLYELLLEYCENMNYDFDKLECYKTQTSFIFCYDNKYFQLDGDIFNQILIANRDQKLNEILK